MPRGARDPYGSRCRDARGYWIPTDECGGIPDDEGSPYTFAVGQNGITRYELKWRVLELSKLVASHDPHTFTPNKQFPQELQPRLRDRAATRVQVEQIAANLDADVLLTDFHAIDRGAPIIGPGNVVESGNGRTMAILRAAEDHPGPYGDYKEALLEIAPTYGISESAVRRLSRPVLVRERTTTVDRAAFVAEANQAATIARSAIEQARTDANAISVSMLADLHVGEDQTLEQALRSRANTAFVARFMGNIPSTEQAAMVDASAQLNQDGVRRVTLAVFVSAFPGRAGFRLAEMGYESLDLDIRNVFNGVARALGALAQAEAFIREGSRDAQLAIADDLAEAATTLNRIKQTPGLTVERFFQQSSFDAQLTDFQAVLLRFLSDNARSAKRMGAVLGAYAAAVNAQPPLAQAGMFGEATRPSREQLWASVNDSTGAAPAPPQASLLSALMGDYAPF